MEEEERRKNGVSPDGHNVDDAGNIHDNGCDADKPASQADVVYQTEIKRKGTENKERSIG